jgi:hypothetical protein
MPKFENKYIYCVWEDWLKGKKVFFSDYIDKLKWRVEKNDLRYVDTIVGNYSENCPFHMKEAGFYSFCYYDPYYELKLAYEQGKKIECKRKGDAWDDWDYTSAPRWLDACEYRIQPEGTNLVTKRELAKWLAMGNGEFQVRRGDQVSCCNEYLYDAQDANETTDIPCVRKWDDDEWHEPTREYLGL